MLWNALDLCSHRFQTKTNSLRHWPFSSVAGLRHDTTSWLFVQRWEHCRQNVGLPKYAKIAITNPSLWIRRKCGLVTAVWLQQLQQQGLHWSTFDPRWQAKEPRMRCIWTILDRGLLPHFGDWALPADQTDQPDQTFYEKLKQHETIHINSWFP